MTSSKPSRTLRVWVQRDIADEMRRYGNVICYSKQSGLDRVRAVLTLSKPPARGKGKRR